MRLGLQAKAASRPVSGLGLGLVLGLGLGLGKFVSDDPGIELGLMVV